MLQAASNVEQPLAKMSKRDMLLVLVLAGVQISHVLDFTIMMPLGPQLMRIFNINARDFGLAVSLYTFSAAFSCFLATMFIDRFDRRRALLVVYCGLILGTFLCGLAPNFTALLVARLVAGFFGGVLQAIIIAIIGDVIPIERRGRAIGIVMSAFSVSSIVGVPVGLAIANAYGWHATFIGLGVFCLVNFALAFWFVPSVREHLKAQAKGGMWQSFEGLLRDTNVWLAVALVISMVSMFAIIPFFGPYFVSIVGITEAELAYVYMFGGIASLLMAPLTGYFVDRYSIKPVFAITTLLVAVVLVLFSNMGPASLFLAIVANIFMSASITARMTPAMALISSSVESKRRGAFMTLIYAVQHFFASLASYAGGLFLGEGPNAIQGYGRLGCVVAAGIMVSLFVGLTVRVRRDDSDSANAEDMMASANS